MPYFITDSKWRSSLSLSTLGVFCKIFGVLMEEVGLNLKPGYHLS